MNNEIIPDKFKRQSLTQVVTPKMAVALEGNRGISEFTDIYNVLSEKRDDAEVSPEQKNKLSYMVDKLLDIQEIISNLSVNPDAESIRIDEVKKALEKSSELLTHDMPEVKKIEQSLNIKIGRVIEGQIL